MKIKRLEDIEARQLARELARHDNDWKVVAHRKPLNPEPDNLSSY